MEEKRKKLQNKYGVDHVKEIISVKNLLLYCTQYEKKPFLPKRPQEKNLHRFIE